MTTGTFLGLFLPGNMEFDLQSLITAWRAGQSSAGAPLVKFLTPLIRGVVRNALGENGILGGFFVREDLLQECLWEVILKLRDHGFKYSSPSSFTGWALIVANNRIRKIARNKNLSVQMQIKSLDPSNLTAEVFSQKLGQPSSTLAQKKEVTGTLLRILPLLPTCQISIIHLRFFEEKPVIEICRILGISRSTYYRQLHGGIQTLRGHIPPAIVSKERGFPGD